MVRDEGEQRDDGDDGASDAPGGGTPRGGKPSRSYFFRTHLDESGRMPALPPAEPAPAPAPPAAGAKSVGEMNSHDPHATIRHGMRFVMPQRQPAKPGNGVPAPVGEETELDLEAPPARPTRRASSEKPLEAFEYEGPPEANPAETVFGDVEDDDPADVAAADEDELITELPPGTRPVRRSTDAPPFEGGSELREEMEKLRAVADLATSVTPPAVPPSQALSPGTRGAPRPPLAEPAAPAEPRPGARTAPPPLPTRATGPVDSSQRPRPALKATPPSWDDTPQMPPLKPAALAPAPEPAAQPPAARAPEPKPAVKPEPKPEAKPAPSPEAPAKSTTRQTTRLEPLTLFGGDADTQKRLREAIAKAAERVQGADGAVTWRVPMGALVASLRDAVPDERDATLARLREELEEVRSALQQTRAKAATLELEVDEARGRTARLESDRTGARDAASRVERERDEARARAQALEKDLGGHRTRTAQLERAAVEAVERVSAVERDLDVERARATLFERERDEARGRAGRLDDQLAGVRQELDEARAEVLGLEVELNEARDQAAQLDADLADLRGQAAATQEQRDAAAERLRTVEARLTAEQRVVEKAREHLLGLQRELAEVRATAAQEIAALAQEYGEARRALLHDLDGARSEGRRLEELLTTLLGGLPDDEPNPVLRDGQPKQVLAALKTIVARLSRLEADRRRAELLVVPPFERTLERLDALREAGDGDDAARARYQRIEARCRAGLTRYTELRDLLQRKQAGARHLSELSGIVRESLVLEQVVEDLAG